MQLPDYGGAFTQGLENGRRAAMEQREAQARIALLQAQAQATQQVVGQTASEVGWDIIAKGAEAAAGKRSVIYVCNGVRGTIPIPGCVVVGFTGD